MDIITDIDQLTNNEEFDDTQFEKLTITSGYLTPKRFYCSTFEDCDFSNCDISNSIFRDCKFINCNLSLAKLINSDLYDIMFIDCKLAGINWTESLWQKQTSKKKRVKFPISFKNCILNYSVFSDMDLYSASFVDSTLKEVSFESANLESATFSGSDLSGSLFLNTILNKADFSSSVNYTIDASINPIKGAMFSFPEASNLLYSLGVEII